MELTRPQLSVVEIPRSKSLALCANAKPDGWRCPGYVRRLATCQHRCDYSEETQRACHRHGKHREEDRAVVAAPG